MSVDTWTQRLHAEAFADDPPCAGCLNADEPHDEHLPGVDGECKFIGCDCEGYRPIIMRDDFEG